MSAAPRFSVLIPTYNRAAYLPAALQSVFAQTCRDYELIVVDDGSSDDTPDLLAQYGDRLHLIRQPNRGPGAARNRGLAEARGEYAVFLDSDDLLLPWALQRLEQAILAHERPAMLMSRPISFEDASAAAPVAQDAPLTAVHHPDYLAAARARYPVTIAVAVRRDVIAAHQGFLEHRDCAEDQDLFLRMGTAAGFVFVTAPPLYAYRQHPTSKSREVGALYRGVRGVLRRERAGGYAGGAARRPERAVILARMARFATRRSFEAGAWALGYRLLLQSLPDIVRAGHWRDLYRLPLLPLRRLADRTAKRRS
jgi:glycosyltransferase involved in cell wall biosynthesis